MRHLLGALLLALTLTLLATPIFAQGAVHIVQPGDTLGQIAWRYGTSVDVLVRANSVANPNLIHVGQRIVIPTEQAVPAAPAESGPPAEAEGPPPELPAASWPAPFASVVLSPEAPYQGRTVLLNVGLTEPARLSGTFRGQELRFRGDGQGGQWALVAVGPLVPVGEHTLALTATTLSAVVPLQIALAVRDGAYPTQNVYLDPATSQLLDPELVEGEARRLEALFKTGGDVPLWDGVFAAPVRGPITANFGVRRRYNAGELRYHEGIDYGLVTGTPVYAAAPGVVALAELLTVRGNTVFIDHGMGVYSGYFHMSELLVEPGQRVGTGDLLGRVGSTGLSTGPHLHWEIRLHGINVSPWQWMETAYP